MQKKTESPKQSLRDTLKATIEKEIEQLPELLEGMEPKDRLSLVVKLMRYVMTEKQPSAWDD